METLEKGEKCPCGGEIDQRGVCFQCGEHYMIIDTGYVPVEEEDACCIRPLR